MTFSTWSQTAASNTSVGGISTDGTVTLVKQIDNMFRGMMAELAVARDDGTITAVGERGYLSGLTLSNNAVDATNDIDIAVGECAAENSPYWKIALASALTKRLDAAWAVGTGNGGLDTGSIANTWYHMWLIQRSDTGVVDALFSTSATSPTMPANYDRKRRIGSVFRQAAALVLFDQLGDTFRWRTNRTLTTVTTGYASQLAIPDVPTGVQTQPILSTAISTSGAQSGIISLGSAAAGAVTNEVCAGQSIAGAVNTVRSFITGGFVTDTSARIYIQQVVVGGPLSASVIVCAGYIDPRGRI